MRIGYRGSTFQRGNVIYHDLLPLPETMITIGPSGSGGTGLVICGDGVCLPPGLAGRSQIVDIMTPDMASARLSQQLALRSSNCGQGRR
jgi:hypothetical protein